MSRASQPRPKCQVSKKTNMTVANSMLGIFGRLHGAKKSKPLQSEHAATHIGRHRLHEYSRLCRPADFREKASISKVFQPSTGYAVSTKPMQSPLLKPASNQTTT